MIHTMQQFMRTNETETLTKSLQQEIATMQRQHLKMEMKYQQKVNTLEKRLKDATDKTKDVQEISKELQEDDVNKDQAIDQLKSQISNFQQAEKEAAADHKQLLNTLQGVLRENTAFQNSLRNAQNKVKDVQNKLKQVEQVRQRDCPAPAVQTQTVPQAQTQTQTKVESQPSQQQPAQDTDVDNIATMGEALPINHYLNQQREQQVEEEGAQDASDSPPAVEAPPGQQAPPAPANSIPSEDELPPSLKLNTPHSAPVKSALSRWLGVGGAAEAAASRLPGPAATQLTQADNSDPADSSNLLAQAQHSVDSASDDDESA